MAHFRQFHFDTSLRQVLVLAVIFYAMSGPLSAQGFKNKVKGVFGKSKASVAEAEVSDLRSEAEVPIIAGGMRNVLLVSSPRHNTEIAENSTIAFIEFSHIAHKITTDIEKEICAAQVAAALAQHLADLNRFKVVTRDHIASVLDEQNFANSGSVSSSSAAQLGELIGADILIYGQVQLCVSNAKKSNSQHPNLQSVGAGGQQPEPVDTLMGAAAEGIGSEILGSRRRGNILGTAIRGLTGGKSKESGISSEKNSELDKKSRSLVLAQIQLIESETGRQIFTTSLQGEFEGDDDGDFDQKNKHELLISKAADDLANLFIDNFLARREERYIGFYNDPAWGFREAIELVQLGDCEGAERHFSNAYAINKYSMGNEDIAKLMYNHGVALMCSNRAEQALVRLWASLRLSDSDVTFAAIRFANDIIDRGRRILMEEDPIVKDVRATIYTAAASE